MAFHRNIDGPTDGHVAHSLSYADAAARAGATGLVVADVGRLARQADDGSFWVLTSHSPVTWLALALVAHAASHNAGGGDALVIDAVAGTGSLRTLGTAATAACAGNDARLSDARTPTAHATSHKSGGGDAVKLDELAAPTDVTTLDATTVQHGLLPKLGGGTSDFLRADGTWAAPITTDTDAIHKSTAGEIAALTSKASPVAADLLVIEDSAAANAKKKITVGSIPLAYSEVESSSTTTTTSSSDVLMSGMSITPAAGEYLCWFSGEVDHSQDSDLTMSIYVNGVREDASQRRVDINNGRNACFACTNHATVTGSQAIEGRWRTSASTASCYRRQLYILKIK